MYKIVQEKTVDGMKKTNNKMQHIQKRKIRMSYLFNSLLASNKLNKL